MSSKRRALADGRGWGLQRAPRSLRDVGWDGRAVFAELGLSIAVSFCSSLVAETVRESSSPRLTRRATVICRQAAGRGPIGLIRAPGSDDRTTRDLNSNRTNAALKVTRSSRPRFPNCSELPCEAQRLVLPGKPAYGGAARRTAVRPYGDSDRT
eukprot:753040-Hanusia_phi.AAC.1